MSLNDRLINDKADKWWIEELKIYFRKKNHKKCVEDSKSN